MSNRFRGLIAQATLNLAGEAITFGYRPGIIDTPFKKELAEHDKKGEGHNFALGKILVDIDYREAGKLEPVTPEVIEELPDFVKQSIWKFVYNVANPTLRSMESRTSSGRKA